jgi:8-oxo-dGTP pyrophosphatase MutT (NUDIX family)
MTHVRVSIVDLYVLRETGHGLEVLLLRRGKETRCTGSWEAVHGRIEEAESPLAAALRELAEETGLSPTRVYNLSRVESFYLHRIDELALIPVFAVFVAPESVVILSDEHDRYEWLSFDAARARFSWPRERRALGDIGELLGTGDTGPLEDVLRIR